MYNLNSNRSEIINYLGNIGADIPSCYFSSNQKVTGFGDKLTKLKPLNKTIWILLIKPSKVDLSTKDVFKNFSNNFSIRIKYNYNYKNLLHDINTNKNDLQKAAESCSPLFSKILNDLPIKSEMLTIPKMTGSGSTIFILFFLFMFGNTKNIVKNTQKFTLKDWGIITGTALVLSSTLILGGKILENNDISYLTLLDTGIDVFASILVAYLFYNEELTAKKIIGLILIMTGVFIIH